MYCFHYFTRHRRRRSPEPELKEELKSQTSEVNRITKSSSPLTSPRGISELYEEKAQNLQVFSFAELQRATTNFSRILMIGEGGFGSVHKGSIQANDGNNKEFVSVAIKRLDPDGFQVIYRDFKTSNALLDENFRPKLSDFGLAREGPTVGHTHVSTAGSVMGTYGYVAPDYIETGHLTTKSDVWSFGVVLYEIRTGRRSLDQNRPKKEQKLLEWVKQHPTNRRRLSLIIDARLEGQYSITGARNVAKLADDCLSKTAKERPRTSQVGERLNQIIMNSDENNNNPPDEKNINPFENDDLFDEEEKPNQPNPSKLWRRRMAHLGKLGEHAETAIGRRFMILQKTKSLVLSFIKQAH